MSVCKNCGHHAPHDRVPGRKSDKWPDPVACTFQFGHLAKAWRWCVCAAFEPDDSPTGKLIAAALELGERAKRDDPAELEEGRPEEKAWVEWGYVPVSDALIAIHAAEKEEADG